jgi:DNA-binding IclR family transcriptional regulator
MSEVKSAFRTMKVLSLLSELPIGMTLSEIASTLDMPMSSAHQLLHEMVDQKFLTLNKTHYQMGIKFFEISRSSNRNSILINAARASLKSVRDQLKTVVQYGILDEKDVVYLWKHNFEDSFRVESQIGGRIPAHVTALGKAMLSLVRDEVITEKYKNQKFYKFTENSIGSFDDLQENLDKARRNGFAEDIQEYTRGVFCISVPLVGENLNENLAISISMSESQLNLINHEFCLKVLREAGAEISKNIQSSYAFFKNQTKEGTAAGLVDSKL